MPQDPRRGYSNIFIYYVGWDHLWGFKILNFNIFGGFQKNKYLLGSEDFVDIFFVVCVCVGGGGGRGRVISKPGLF